MVCGCGIPDVDSDGDFIMDCRDVCVSDPKKYHNAGVCGCNVDDIDSDSDGVMDCADVCPQNPTKSVDASICGCDKDDIDMDSDGVYTCQGGNFDLHSATYIYVYILFLIVKNKYTLLLETNRHNNNKSSYMNLYINYLSLIWFNQPYK